MSGWGMGWFGGGSSSSTSSKKKDAPKNAILQLRSTLDMLSKREKHLQNQMDEQDGLARKFVSTNKAGTLAFGEGGEEKEQRRSFLFMQRGQGGSRELTDTGEHKPQRRKRPSAGKRATNMPSSRRRRR